MRREHITNPPSVHSDRLGKAPLVPARPLITTPSPIAPGSARGWRQTWPMFSRFQLADRHRTLRWKELEYLPVGLQRWTADFVCAEQATLDQRTGSCAGDEPGSDGLPS
jgi:hypothetical protein